MSDEETKKKKWNWTPIIMPILAALVAATATWWWREYDGRLRMLRYTVTSTHAIFPKPVLRGKTVTVGLDGRTIDNISTVTIHVFNDSGHFSDVPIHIRFEPIEGKPAKLIEIKSDLPPERLTETVLPDLGDGSVRTGQIVKVFNKGETFRVDALFEGIKAPNVSLETMVKGLKAERVTMESADKDHGIAAIFEIPLALLIISVIAAVSVAFFVQMRLEIALRRKIQQLRKKLNDPRA
jgi:hypothetical protein